MKIRIMKRQVLDTLKSNLEHYIKYYYQSNDNGWLYEVCNCEPFEEYKVVSDFQLADLDQKPSEIDFNNCKILYANLSFLSESQACDERLWAGLCHDIFYKYLRERFKMHGGMMLKDKNPIGNVKTRFFFNGGVSSGLYRNALSKCWWVGYHTWVPEEKSFGLLDKMGSTDMSTKVSDIFHNYSFSNNKKILEGIVEALYYFNKENIPYNMMKHVRPSLQYLNAVGGGVVLDEFESYEIKDIMINQMINQLKGIKLLLDEEEEGDIELEVDTIEIGDKFKVKFLSGSKKDQISSPIVVSYNNYAKLFPNAEKALGHKKGDVIKIILSNEEFDVEIVEIIKDESVDEE